MDCVGKPEIATQKRVIDFFQTKLRYNYIGNLKDRETRNIDEEKLITWLTKHGYAKAIAVRAVEELVKAATNLQDGLYSANREVYRLLKYGAQVKANADENETTVYFIDWETPGENIFDIAEEVTVVANNEKRPDLVIYLNGIAVAIIELKKSTVSVSNGIRQNLTNQREMFIEPFFTTIQFCMAGNDSEGLRYGTIKTPEKYYLEWKKDGFTEYPEERNEMDVHIEEVCDTISNKLDSGLFAMFYKARFLNLIHNFLIFDKGQKKVCRYNQYYGIMRAQKRLSSGKGGIIWHTQGSGKSLSMVFYAHYLQKALESPTIVVITDRNDLDNQLYGQFSRCRDFLRQTPQQAESRQHLQELLAGRQANGIIFTTMQKFEETGEPLSERRNIVVMADEAHRGQYGLTEKLVTRQNEKGELEVRTSIGTARIIRDSLPNATYIGFTGTPISARDRSTRDVFGDYIDIYDMTQAVEDGATRPVYYESRGIHLNLDKNILRLIDAEYDLMAENADPYVIEKSKKELGQMEAILGADQTIASLVDDILDHYENYRAHLLTGKAMIVAYSRPIAMKIYKRILQLRPDWTEKVGVVMTQGNNDPEEWREIIGNKAHKEELARKFKGNDSPLKIAIVVDMWLTGFDVPSLATMYVYKPMAGHNLMQAIARVNRVFRDKEGGLVVDYVGIAAALKQAMNDYTVRDKKNYGDPDVGKAAYPKFLEKLEVCRDLFHGFDYTGFLTGDDLEKARMISGGVNFLLGQSVAERGLPDSEKTQNVYIKEALLLRQALSLCSSMVDERTRFEAAYFEAVRTMLVRLTTGGTGKKFTLPEVNQRINELLKHSIQSEGVINLFSDVGTEFSLFDPKFLEEIAGMKEKNLAVELLKKLIAEQVSIYRRTNLVKSEKFSEIIQSVMNRYLNGMLTNEEVIQELLKLAKEISNAHAEGVKLGLTAEELAFYDAITKPQAIKDFYERDELIAITKELTDLLRQNRTIDWQKKESARAGMRRLVKRLLKKHKYPPEGMEDAVQTVMSQCEMWTDAMET